MTEERLPLWAAALQAFAWLGLLLIALVLYGLGALVAWGAGWTRRS